MDDQTIGQMHALAQEAGFDKKPFDVCQMLITMLRPMADGHIDSGGGHDSADPWVTIGGVEYFFTVRKSNNQLEKEKVRARTQ